MPRSDYQKHAQADLAQIEAADTREPNYAQGVNYCYLCEEEIPRGLSRVRMIMGRVVHFCQKCQEDV